MGLPVAIHIYYFLLIFCNFKTIRILFEKDFVLAEKMLNDNPHLKELYGKNNWMLDTILEERGNCHLYEKMGYKRTGEYKKISDIQTLVYYEK